MRGAPRILPPRFVAASHWRRRSQSKPLPGFVDLQLQPIPIFRLNCDQSRSRLLAVAEGQFPFCPAQLNCHVEYGLWCVILCSGGCLVFHISSFGFSTTLRRLTKLAPF